MPRGVPYIELGVFIKLRREQLKLSKASLGRLIGVTGPAVGSYENGRTRPARTSLLKLLDIFGVKGNELKEVPLLSSYELTAEELETGLPTLRVQDAGGPKILSASGDSSLILLMERHGISSIVAFLADSGNDSLIRTILDIQQRRGKPLSIATLERVTMMGRINRLSLSLETWATVIAELEGASVETPCQLEGADDLS